MTPDEHTPRIPVNVLVVDDREANRLALRSILNRSGYQLVEAASAAEALRHLLATEFALLLVDVVMPDMNGIELARLIRQRERTASVPILFLTAEATDHDHFYQAYQLGAVDYLVKPVVPEMVRAKVAVFAELFRQRKRLEQQSQLLLAAERREAEVKLMELRLATDRHYRSLAEAVPHIIWTAGPDGRVDYFNQRWFEYTGLTTAESGSQWMSVIHPDDAEGFGAQWRTAVKSGTLFHGECRLRRGSDGALRWHLFRAVPERGPSGEIDSWVGTFTDVDESRRAQEWLAEFRATLDAVLDAVLIFEPDVWRFSYANQGAAVLLGYPHEEILRMPPQRFMCEHDEAGLRELFASVRDQEQILHTVETRYRRSDGSTVPVELSMQAIRIDGCRIVSIARDITERRRAEAEREELYREAVAAVRARDEFLSVASHELRTPLTSLLLQIESLLRASRPGVPATRTPEQVVAKLEVAARQVDRLSRLVEELLDVSRIETGRLKLEVEEIDLAALVRDLAARFSEEAARLGTLISVDAGQPVVGRWDRLRIEQVCTNLLANALKFGAGKPIEVFVDRTAHGARLRVRDYGIGIEHQHIERIFRRFERAVSTRDFAGLGLGLYIVRQIVDAHGGAISVESRPNEGSTFVVELPREAAPAHADEHAVASSPQK